MEENDEIEIFKYPVKDNVPYGQYKFEWQRLHLNVPPSAMRDATVAYYESRAIESHLVSNPWLLFTVTPSVLYSHEPDFLKKCQSVSAYRTCELYMITKMAMEIALDKKKLNKNVLSLWEKAHWQWQSQSYGVPSLNTETGQYVVKGSPISNGQNVLRELTVVLDPDRPENQDATPAMVDARQNLVTMMINATLHNLCEWITATEYYLSKLATFIGLFTNKGHCTYNGDWKKYIDLAGSCVGSAEFYRDVNNYPRRYTAAGSILYVDYWINPTNKNSLHAQRCEKFLGMVERCDRQLNRGEALSYDQVLSKKFNAYVDEYMRNARIAKGLDPDRGLKPTDQKSKETTEEKETTKESPSEKPPAEQAAEDQGDAPPPPPELIRQMTVPGGGVGNGPSSSESVDV